MNNTINKLIIVAGQWQKFREKQYERQFAKLLDDLAWELQASREDALEYFMAHLGEKEGVVA